MAKAKIRGKLKRIKFSKFKFRNYVLENLCEQLNNRIRVNIGEFRKYVKELVYEIIMTSVDSDKLREYGLARWELGIPNVDGKILVDSVARTTADNVQVTLKKMRRVGANIGGRIKVSVIKSDYSDVLGLPQAEIITEKWDFLPVLKWILTMGNDLIQLPLYDGAKGYRVVYERGRGRSGGAYMEPTENSSEFFRVNTHYSGTEDDNWLIRAMTEKLPYFHSQIINFLNTKVF